MNDYIIYIEKNPRGLYQIRTVLKGQTDIFDKDLSLDLRTAYAYAQMIYEELIREGINISENDIWLSIADLEINSKLDAASFKAWKSLKKSGVR